MIYYLIVAPLWTDIDGSNQGNPTRVFYRQYEYAGDGDQNATFKDMFMTGRANRDVRNFVGETGFKSSFVMVITWEKTALWPAPITVDVRVSCRDFRYRLD